MTDDEINEAIAETLGRKYHKPTDAEMESGGYYQYEPHYTKDLNAMHEVEMSLKGSKEDEYCEMADYQEHLCLICGDRVEPPNVYDIDLIRATARQRAEAYLRTIGKWKE